jgi:hypothetical protein
LHVGEAAGLGDADVDDHVDFVGTLLDGEGGLGGFDAAVVFAAGEAADGGDLEVGAASAIRAVTSAAVASGLRRVWSIMRATVAASGEREVMGCVLSW